MKKTILAALALLVLVSCNKESGTVVEPQSGAVNFSSTPLTRVSNGTWDVGDKIGIFMVAKGETDLTVSISLAEALNVPYTAASNGVASSDFTTTTENTIYYPVDGSAVDFYAYYPYASDVTSGVYSVDVSSQVAKNIDLLTATVTDMSKNSTLDVNLSFFHQLTKLTLNLTKGDGMLDLAGLTTRIVGHNTTAKLNLQSLEISELGTVADVALNTSEDGVSVTAILLPTAAMANSSIVFTLDGNDYIWDISALAFEQGKEYKYNVRMTKIPIVVGDAEITPWGEVNVGDIDANDTPAI